MLATSVKALMAAAAVIGGLTLTATSASAHTVKDWITDNPGDLAYRYGFVEVNANGGAEHTQIAVCDTKGDRIGVWVEFYYRAPGSRDDRYGKISDTNGSGPDCGRFTVPSGGRILGYQGGQRGVADATGWNWNL